MENDVKQNYDLVELRFTYKGLNTTVDAFWVKIFMDAQLGLDQCIFNSIPTKLNDRALTI